VVYVAVVALIAAAVGAFALDLGDTTPKEPVPRFEDVTEDVGLPVAPTMSHGVVFADFDGNGYPDLFVNRHVRRPYLFGNREGERFALHPEDFYPRRVDRHNCAWGDANGNGRLDLLCTTGALRGEGRDPNQLYVQEAGGAFTDMAGDYRIRYAKARGRTVNWLDYDGDGRLDFFVTTALREGFPNALFRNDGNGFTRVDAGVGEHLRSTSSSWADWNRSGRPDLLVTQNHNPIVAYENRGGRFVKVDLPGITDLEGNWLSAAWGDFDGDGWPDLHLVSHRRALLLHNDNGEFRRVHETTLSRGRMSLWFDHDNSGRLDLYVVQGADEPGSPNHPNFMLVQGPDGSFEEVHDPSFRGPRSGNGDSAAAADFDRDGRVDLFVANGHRPLEWSGPGLLLRNVTEAGNWIGIDLEGPRGNPWGFGARITVRSPDASYERQVTDGVVNRTQSEVGYLHLGIGGSPSARARVAWPDGVTDCIELEAGNRDRLRHGSSPC
jgi:hypothetical protein